MPLRVFCISEGPVGLKRWVTPPGGKTAYRRHPEIEERARWRNGSLTRPLPPTRTLDVAACRAVNVAGYEIPTDDILDELIQLEGPRSIASEISPGPFHDVYQAALAFVCHRGWWSRPDEEDPQWRSYTIPGQRRDDWQVIPKLLRVEPSQPSFTREEIRHRIRRAHGFSMLLKERDSSLSDGEAMAIAQHYSEEEACLGTWLIQC